MMQQENLFEEEPLPKGWISARCNVQDDDAGQRYVFIDEVWTYTYDLADSEMQRFVWVNIYKQHCATYQQISSGIGISLRALKYWVKKERESGSQGLMTQKSTGRKPTSAEKKNQIIRLRKERLTYREIARLCGVCGTTVFNVLQEDAALRTASPQLAFTSEADAEVEAEVSEADAEADAEAEIEVSETGAEVEVSKADDATELSQNIDSETNVAEKRISGKALVTESSDPEIIAYEDELEAAMAKDRSSDRILARLGKLSDAEPLFAPGQGLPFAGLFIVFALLASDPFLKVGLKVFAPFGAAFYGVRTTLMTLIAMAFLRLKRPEDLRRDNPIALGRILGLDRVQEVKTARGKISRLSSPERTEKFMRLMAFERSQEYAGDITTVMVDGHVVAYSGKRKVGSTWSSRDNRVMNGQTENWVNLQGMCPLFSVETPFNEGLTKSLEDALEETRKVLAIDELTAVFDRGGFSVESFERLTKNNLGIITYRKGNYENIDESLFVKTPTIIGNKEYEYAPLESEIELKVYESVDRGPNQKPGRRFTGRTIKMREIRVLRSDGGQTSVITNCHVKIPCMEVLAILFSRIGSQENIFKYMRTEFDIDAMACYAFEDVGMEVEHPNPDFSALEKEAATLRKKRDSLLAELGKKVQSAEPEQAAEALRKFKHATQLEKINNRLDMIKAEKTATPIRENATAAGYKRPKMASKRLMNVIKIAAYMIETKLFERLETHYKNNKKEGRKLLATTFRTAGALKLAPGKIIITLEPQSSPARTKAINGLTADLNKMNAKFPGSTRVIQFEPTSIPEK